MAADFIATYGPFGQASIADEYVAYSQGRPFENDVFVPLVRQRLQIVGVGEFSFDLHGIRNPDDQNGRSNFYLTMCGPAQFEKKAVYWLQSMSFKSPPSEKDCSQTITLACGRNGTDFGQDIVFPSAMYLVLKGIFVLWHERPRIVRNTAVRLSEMIRIVDGLPAAFSSEELVWLARRVPGFYDSVPASLCSGVRVALAGGEERSPLLYLPHGARIAAFIFGGVRRIVVSGTCATEKRSDAPVCVGFCLHEAASYVHMIKTLPNQDPFVTDPEYHHPVLKRKPQGTPSTCLPDLVIHDCDVTIRSLLILRRFVKSIQFSGTVNFYHDFQRRFPGDIRILLQFQASGIPSRLEGAASVEAFIFEILTSHCTRIDLLFASYEYVGLGKARLLLAEALAGESTAEDVMMRNIFVRINPMLADTSRDTVAKLDRSIFSIRNLGPLNFSQSVLMEIDQQESENPSDQDLGTDQSGGQLLSLISDADEISSDRASNAEPVSDLVFPILQGRLLFD